MGAMTQEGANAGAGSSVGRCRARPSALVNSRLVTGFGAIASTGFEVARYSRSLPGMLIRSVIVTSR